MHEDSAIVELRQYTLHAGRRDELIELFEDAFVESQEAAGIRLEGLFRDPERTDTFVWIRSFPDMGSRQQSLTLFYDGPVWAKRREAANATMADSDNVLLLCGPALGDSVELSGPLCCAVYELSGQEELAAFRNEFESRLRALLETTRGRIVAIWQSEKSVNTFPRLPVREDAFALVALIDGASMDLIQRTQPSHLFELTPTRRSRLQLGRVRKD